jgi:hypothetical protein
VAAGYLEVRFAVAGSQPCPAAQLRRAGEPADIADLGDDDRRQDRADTRQDLERAVPVMTPQQVGDDGIQQGDLGSELAGELA